MCELGELTRPCGAATPGIAKMYAVDTHDVVSVPVANADWTITGNIVLKAGKYWKDIPFAETKAGLTDDIADAVGGGFSKSIPFTLPKYAADSNKWINNAIGARFLVLVADNNDQIALVGSIIAGMRLQKATGNTGQKQGDVNGWDVTFQAEGTKPCYFYEGAIPLAGVAPVTYTKVMTFTSGTNYQQDASGGVGVTIVGAATGDTAKYNTLSSHAGQPLLLSIRTDVDDPQTEVSRFEGTSAYSGASYELTHGGVTHAYTISNGNVQYVG